MNREQVSVERIQQDIIKSVMFHDVYGAFVVIPVLWGCFMLIALPLELIFTSVPLGWIVTVFFLILEFCYLAVICGTLICVKTLKFTGFQKILMMLFLLEIRDNPTVQRVILQCFILQGKI